MTKKKKKTRRRTLPWVIRVNGDQEFPTTVRGPNKTSITAQKLNKTGVLLGPLNETTRAGTEKLGYGYAHKRKVSVFTTERCSITFDADACGGRCSCMP
jgi:hypothetical protein